MIRAFHSGETTLCLTVLILELIGKDRRSGTSRITWQMSTSSTVNEIPVYSQLYKAIGELKQPTVYRITAAVIGNECAMFVDASDISPFFTSRDFKTLEMLLKDGFQKDLIRSLSSVILAMRSVAYDCSMTEMTEEFAKFVSLAQMMLNQSRLMHYIGSFRELCKCADALFRNPQAALTVLGSQCLQWIQYLATEVEKEEAVCFDMDVLEQVSEIASNVVVTKYLPSLEELNKQLDAHVAESSQGVAHALLRSSIRSKVMHCMSVCPVRFVDLANCLYDDNYNQSNPEDHVKMDAVMNLLGEYSISESLFKNYFNYVFSQRW